mgnify:CR=1 FL=1
MQSTYLQLAVGPTLDHAFEGGIVVCQADLASGLIQGGVGLDKDLAWLLVCKHDITDLGAPEPEIDIGHAVVELGTLFDISGGLVNVNLLEVVGDSYSSRLAFGLIYVSVGEMLD